MNERVWKELIRYDSLPTTPEKEKLNKSYLSDEIGSFEFASEISKYLKKYDNKLEQQEEIK